MPKYAKFLKVLLSNKTRLEEACTVTMNERCLAVLLNKLPSKEKDPRSFTIPYDIGNLHINDALAGLGASISLMPYTMYENLGLGEPKPKRMSLELADRSIQYPRGIAENVLIKIDKFILPIDFVILDMREDSKILIILGRPFLSTARAMIDVFNKKITLRVGNEEESIDLSDLESYGKVDYNVESRTPIRCIEELNTPYLQEINKTDKTQYEHLYSTSANEIDKKRPVLKDLPSYLEYVYLKGDESCLDSFKFLWHQKIKRRQLLLVLMELLPTEGCRLDYATLRQPFERCITTIFHDMVEDFMDDFSVFGNSFDQCLNNLGKMLVRCEETNLVLNKEKCHFMVKEGLVLGHKISGKGIEVDKVKIDVIAKLPYPSNVKGVRSFLGHTGFYRRFIKFFSMISKPMIQLSMKDVKFDFSKDCKKAFNKLKEKLTTAPIIISPDWIEPFELMCAASDFAVGAVLGQRIDKKFKPIYYASKTLNDAQAHYTTTEKELAVVFSFDKFHPYLILSKTIVYTDHSALKYLFNKQDAKPRLIR
ncbi:reverse transcriptase domain-containing protein [Tanacetum coccineum]